LRIGKERSVNLARELILVAYIFTEQNKTHKQDGRAGQNIDVDKVTTIVS